LSFPRTSGVLLHPTSLEGRFGIGDLGDAAYRFLDFLEAAGQQIWQILPLGPTGYGDSPYQSFSAFAGNPLLVSPELLVKDALLSEGDLAGVPDFPADRVDFGRVIEYKQSLLTRAHENLNHASPELRLEFDEFRQTHASWLNDYALYRALKNEHEARRGLTGKPR